MTTQPSQRQFQPYPDVPLAVTEVGEGRPVLVLHGGAGPAGMTEIVDHLSPTHRVIVPTHPGWEGTPRPEWFAGMDSLVETYLDLLDDLGLRDVVVVGSSFGGWVAAELTVRDRGHRVGGLVLMDAIGPRMEAHEVHMPGSGAKEPGGPGRQPQQDGGQPAGAPGGPPRAAIEALMAYAGPNLNDPKLLPRLARMKVPALVLWGEKDTVVAPAFGRVYAAAIPNARFELIPGARHVPSREEPEAALAAIDAFLNEKG